LMCALFEWMTTARTQNSSNLSDGARDLTDLLVTGWTWNQIRATLYVLQTDLNTTKPRRISDRPRHLWWRESSAWKILRMIRMHGAPHDISGRGTLDVCNRKKRWLQNKFASIRALNEFEANSNTIRNSKRERLHGKVLPKR
jgi:hypothetical protein